MLVELDRLAVVLLRVGEQPPLHVLAPGSPQDRLGGDPLVNVQGHRVCHAPLLLPLARPLQPRLMIPQCLLEDADLGGLQLLPARLPDELLDPIRLACSIEPQAWGQVWIVGIPDLPLFDDLPTGSQPGRRDVQPGHPVVP